MARGTSDGLRKLRGNRGGEEDGAITAEDRVDEGGCAQPDESRKRMQDWLFVCAGGEAVGIWAVRQA